MKSHRQKVKKLNPHYKVIMECFNLKWSERELLKTREHYGMEDFISVVSLDDDGLWMGVFPGSKRTHDSGSVSPLQGPYGML